MRAWKLMAICLPMVIAGGLACPLSARAAPLSLDVQIALGDPNACWERETLLTTSGKWVPVSLGPMSNSALTAAIQQDTYTQPDSARDPENIYYHKSGYRYHRVPCPPKLEGGMYSWQGFYIGGALDKGWGHLKWNEVDRFSGDLTSSGTVTHDPLGVGISVGYGFMPFGNGIVVDPFLSFDYLGWSVNQTFPGGSFLGTKSNYEGTAGVKIGPTIASNTWLYALAGASFLSEKLTVNFIPASSSTTTTVAGATVGAGVAYMPTVLQGFGHPIAVFAEYQHTWWQDGTFSAPASSPFFNYKFQRSDDMLKVGLNIYFNAPGPVAASTPPYPVKAPVK